MDKDQKQDMLFNISIHAYKQFALFKEKLELKDEDFTPFAIGYTLGIVCTADSLKEV